MKQKTKTIILLVVGVQIILIVSFLTLPSAVQAIPGRYRVALQERSPFLSNIAEGVIDQVAPVATALPAPAPASSGEQIDIAALIEQKSTAVPPPTALPTAVPTTAPESNETEAIAVAPIAVPTVIIEPTATLEPTPEPLPSRIVLANMGVVQQTFNNCGPANLTQVLNWHGSDITQTAVADYLKPNPEDRNVSPWQIADYVNDQTPGYQAIARSGGSLALVKKLVAAGYPVVIEKGYELPSSGWWGHYLTIYGYDDALQELYSQDSFLGPFDGSGRVDSYSDIEHFWQQFNYVFYVVYRPDQAAEVETLLGPDMFNDFTMWQNVATIAIAEAEAQPDDAFAQFNLGTALTRLGRLGAGQEYYQGGAQAFDRAREIGLKPRMLWYQFEIYLAYRKVDRNQDVIDLANATLETQGGRNVEETYWYKGHALATLGDIGGAKNAYQDALDINHNFYPAQTSLDWINSLEN